MQKIHELLSLLESFGLQSWKMLRSTLTCIMPKLQQLSTMKELEQTQAFITKTGLFTHPVVVGKLISFASLHPSGSLTYAQAMFDETPMDNPFVCNTMIRAYCKSIFPINALNIYNHMNRMNVVCDHFTYNFVLKACARVLYCMDEDARCGGFGLACKGAEIHCRVFKSGMDCDHIIQNSLVYLYSQCGLVGIARHLFDEMTVRTVTSWNIMMSAYDKINDFESADLLLKSMPVKNVVSWNTLIGRYVRLRNIRRARNVFDQMPDRDEVSWNSMIAGYVRIKDYAKGLELFRVMQNAMVEPTEMTLISVLGACAETGALEMGRKIHESLRQKQYKIEGYLGNALVDMYAKCGNLGWAREVFDELEMKHISCWNAMIVGLAVHGYSEEALEFFSAMERRVDVVKPNRVTFIGVLIACRHKGMVEEGRQYFSRMIKEYKIVPDVKHYGCMVDLLSRWGLLDEACQMIKTTPAKENSVLWRTLLAACRVHSNVELAKEAFEQLAKLEPLRDGDYVLLSNIYAEAERWNDVEQVRDNMINSRVPKKIGSSNIEMSC